MESNAPSFPVRSKYMNLKSNRNASDAPNFYSKTKSSLLRDRRVFGTARNPNVPSKTAAPENPTKAMSRKAEKPSQATRSRPVADQEKSTSETNAIRPKKKSVSFDVEKIEKDLPNDEPQTPVKLTPDVAAKPRRSATPYHTADKCSKCRFDKLETSAYWMGQIKLAESVGKHSVSAAFFGLALDCRAEPIRSIRVELKKYLARHEYLNQELQWQKLVTCYGLVKEEFGINDGNIEIRRKEENGNVKNEEDEQLLRDT